MITLFDSDDEECDFLGFEANEIICTDEMISLFESDDEGEFLGFPASDLSIMHLDNNEGHKRRALSVMNTVGTFMGPESHRGDMDNLFLSDDEDDTFLGF